MAKNGSRFLDVPVGNKKVGTLFLLKLNHHMHCVSFRLHQKSDDLNVRRSMKNVSLVLASLHFPRCREGLHAARTRPFLIEGGNSIDEHIMTNLVDTNETSVTMSHE